MNSAKAFGLIALVAAAFALPSQAASPAAEASARLLAQAEPRIKAIYDTDELRMRSFRATWLPDGSGYLKLETPDGASGAQIARYDSASGQRTVVLAGEKLLVPGTSERLRLRGFVRSPSGKRFLLHTETTAGGSNTLNALFRKPDAYHVGIAVVPKPQAQYYNAWYQEIFMRTPKDNPEGYRTSSAINFAEGLRGDLLIITGSGESNTHVEITEGLVDRLIALGKRFDYFVYPNRDHGLSEGKGTTVHVQMLITRHLVEHLPPRPR